MLGYNPNLYIQYKVTAKMKEFKMRDYVLQRMDNFEFKKQSPKTTYLVRERELEKYSLTIIQKYFFIA